MLEDADIYTVNDNEGQLFEMYRTQSGTLEVPDPKLYIGRRGPDMPERTPDVVGAIGSIRRTDVLDTCPAVSRNTWAKWNN